LQSSRESYTDQIDFSVTRSGRTCTALSSILFLETIILCPQPSGNYKTDWQPVRSHRKSNRRLVLIYSHFEFARQLRLQPLEHAGIAIQQRPGQSRRNIPCAEIASRRGVNLAFGDGRVTLLSDSINGAVYAVTTFRRAFKLTVLLCARLCWFNPGHHSISESSQGFVRLILVRDDFIPI